MESHSRHKLRPPVPGQVTLKHVIPTEAKRSGGTLCLARSRWGEFVGRSHGINYV